MPRRRWMTEKRDVVRRLKVGQSIRTISGETGMHRVTIRGIRKIAVRKGWLSGGGLPEEQEIAEAFAEPRREFQPHILDGIRDRIAEWLERGAGYTAIHQLVNDYVRCSEPTVRRYIQKRFATRPKLSVPRTHEPGTLEIDFGYAGVTYDETEKRNRKTWLFSARFAFSRYAWRERVYRMDQETFLRCHTNAFQYFGGVPVRVVPDNLKQAILKASYSEPIPNLVYQEFAIHHGFLISPCLPATPEHKGGVESDIKYIKGNFWPVFRERQRCKGRDVPDGRDMAESLAAWSAETANRRTIKGVGVSPSKLFEDAEKPALKPLPEEAWTRLEVAQPKVQSAWCVQFDRAIYSVPWRYVGKQVRVLANGTTVRIFHDHQEIAAHPRARNAWQVVRNRLHEPPNAAEYIKTTRSGTLSRAEALGADVAEVCRRLLEQKGIDGLRPARAVLALCSSYGPERLRGACRRILSYDMVSYRAVHACLKNNLDLKPTEDRILRQRLFAFARPAGYFAQGGAS